VQFHFESKKWRRTLARDSGINMKKKIIEKEIIKDIASGMSDSALTQKYNLSGDQLRSIFKQLADARAKRIQTLASDLRSGMARSELMKKYQLSSEALASSLNRLLKANAITSAELERFNSCRDEHSSGGSSRGSVRNQPIPVVTICEVGKPGTRYLVRDISENGIGVTGITAQVDEMKSLAVVGDEFGEIAPFEFEAQCRWARQLEPDGATCAGFRITRISDQDVLRLREFVQGFTFWIEEA
jgi:Mor family transcriptional regulator